MSKWDKLNAILGKWLPTLTLIAITAIIISQIQVNVALHERIKMLEEIHFSGVHVG